MPFKISTSPSRTCELLVIPKQTVSLQSVYGVAVEPCSLKADTDVSEEHAVLVLTLEIIRVSMLSVCMEWHGMWLLRIRQERRDPKWASRNDMRKVLAEFYVRLLLFRLLLPTHRRCRG